MGSAGIGDNDHLRTVLDVVLKETADLLGQSPDVIDPQRAYLDYGYNSLAALELTSQLGRAFGLELPMTMLFDHPNPDAVARYLVSRIEMPADTTAADENVADPAPADAAPAEDAAPADDDPIVIVGVACRYPGGVDSPAALWRLVEERRDAISEFPTDRGWPLAELYHPDPDHPGTTYSKSGGFITGATEFDADFFGISPREALAMDPQQRLLLEGAWEVFEDAGIDPAALRATPTGVFAGVSGVDYSYVARSGGSSLQGYWGIGTLPAVASGRVAYTFGFEGPALTVDTACSSSLVATHLAMQSLRRGESSLALVAGVTVASTPTVYQEFSRQRALSADGRCRSFAAAADGTGFSDGLGVLLLERLSDARRAGRRVYGVLRGSAVNQDGASNGMTAPNGPSQERVIRAALADAGLSPADVDAVEGHGTATVLGDPIEAQALLATYGQDRAAGRPLWLGSLKSNIGHSQAAAGVGGIIKMVMAMGAQSLPATLHVDEPTSKVDWSSGAVELLREAREWPRAGSRPRRAGVSSFGASGTNAHVIVEEPPPLETPAEAVEPEGGPGGPAVWVLSGKLPSGLTAQARRLREWVAARPELNPLDIGYSLATDRAQLSHRAVLIGNDRTELLTRLAQIEHPAPGQDTAPGATARPGRVAFIFPGQGSQWAGMAVELLATAPVFAERMAECAEALAPYVDWNLIDVLKGEPDAPTLERVDVVQPALFAVMVSLAALWRSYGVEPEAVVGHSQGEIAAACVAGGLTLEDAARIVALRSQAIATLGRGGGMLSIAESAADVRARLAVLSTDLSIAAVNSPSSVIVSGGSKALNELYEDCVAENVWARWISVDYASHSAQVEDVRQRLATDLAPVSPRSTAIDFHSTVKGALVDTATLDAAYWYDNLRDPVLFEDAVRDLVGRGYRTFIEISPHPVLAAPISHTVESAAPDTRAVVSGTLKRDQGRIEDFLGSVGEAYVNGVDVDWSAAFAGRRAHRVELPHYAFTRQRFWPATGAGDGGADLPSAGLTPGRHPFLAGQVRLAGDLGHLFTGRVDLERQPWLADHTVFGEVVVPGTALVELAAASGARLGAPVVEELTLESPLLVREDGIGIQLQVTEPDAGGRAAFTLYSDDGTDGWTRNASGVLASGALEGQPGPVAGRSASAAGQADPADGQTDPVDGRSVSVAGQADLVAGRSALVAGQLDPPGEQPAPAPAPEPDRSAVWPPQGAVAIGLGDLYGRLADRGMEYGRAFRGLRSAWRFGDEICADVLIDGTMDDLDPRHLLHPALLDAAFHAAFADRAGDRDAGSAMLPFAWSGVRLYPGDRAPQALRVRLTPVGGDAVRMIARDDQGRVVASVDSVLARPVSTAQLAAARAVTADCLFAVDWTPVTPTAAPAEAMAVLDATALDATALGVTELGATELGATELGATAPGATGPGVTAPGTTPLGVTAGTATPHPAWVIAPLGSPENATAVPDAARAVAAQVLALLRDWLTNAQLPDTRLALVTRSAVAARPGDEPDPALAPVWGLVRSAQAEHPGKFALVDLDADAGEADLAAALTLGEPQVAVREGALLVPRMARRRPAGTRPVLDPESTVLITGGTGGLGALVARHLVTEHGVRHLLLASRRGRTAEGADALADELTGLGAQVSIEACDVSDRAAVAGLLSGVAGEHPLRAVVHAAGVLDDGLITSLTEDQLDRVLRAKADSAWHLHELTEGLDLTAFVLFSSLAGAIGGPGQGNYAAANTFLDALAARRRAQGLPAVSIAYGLWEEHSDMTGHLSSADAARLARSGVVALSADEGLQLLDATLESADHLVLAARLDMAALRTQAATGMAPALLRDLVPAAPDRPAAASAALLDRLADLTRPERERELLRLVRAEIAAVLQYPGPDAIAPDRAFNEIGFDSLGAVQLRNRLNVATGLRLPVTAVFDHPTPRAVSLLLADRLYPATDDCSTGPAATADDGTSDPAAGLDAMDAEDLVRMALRGDDV
ncbi:type I polyketide synthase [Streptomyces sp. NPDC059037]|uniref:type I polyketide synthase n=1 Tax=Streptomyces sp. NPDC059037 TaxID=3346710 RepID=UPI0036C4A33C